MHTGPITTIMNQAATGDREAAERLWSLVYEQLRAEAQRAMRRERADHTLQATALVHEAFVKLVGSAPEQWDGRAQFYFAAARAMRQLLIDHARAKGRRKRGSNQVQARLSDVADLATDGDEQEILALDGVLQRLEEEDPDVAMVVRLRFYAGLTVDQTARSLGIAPRQVDRLWAYGRALLFRALESVRREDAP